MFSSNTSFEEWALHWLKVHKMGLVKDITYDLSYRNPVERYLIPHFGKRPLVAITPGDIQTFFKGLTDKLALESQKKILNALRQIFEVAIDYGICRTTPIIRRLKLTSNIKPVEKQSWSFEEYKTAFKFALNHPHGLEIITLMETAISRSELLGLEWSSLIRATRTLRLTDGLVSQRSTFTGQYELAHDGLKNQYRYRELPLSPLLFGLLSLKPRTIIVRGRTVAPKYIFHAPQGGPFDPNNRYKRVLLPFMVDLHEVHPDVKLLTTHELRHTRATLLNNKGVSLLSIARLLGHADLNMLAKRYAHNDLDALRQAIGIDELYDQYLDVV